MFNHKGEIGLPLVIKKFILAIIEFVHKFVDKEWKLMKIKNRPNWNHIFKLKIELDVIQMITSSLFSLFRSNFTWFKFYFLKKLTEVELYDVNCQSMFSFHEII